MFDIPETDLTPENLIQGYSTRGFFYHMKGDFTTAFENYHKGYLLAEKIHNYSLIDKMSYNCANLKYHYTGEYDESLGYYQVGVENAKNDNNKEREGFFLSHVAMAEFQLGNVIQALDAINQSLLIFSENPGSMNYIFSLLEKVKFLNGQKQFKKSFELLKPHLKTALRMKDSYANTLPYYYLSQMINHLDQKSIDGIVSITSLQPSQLGLLKLAENNIEKQPHELISVIIYLELARLDVEKGLYYLNKAKRIANESNRIPPKKLIEKYEMQIKPI